MFICLFEVLFRYDEFIRERCDVQWIPWQLTSPSPKSQAQTVSKPSPALNPQQESNPQSIKQSPNFPIDYWNPYTGVLNPESKRILNTTLWNVKFCRSDPPPDYNFFCFPMMVERVIQIQTLTFNWPQPDLERKTNMTIKIWLIPVLFRKITESLKDFFRFPSFVYVSL